VVNWRRSRMARMLPISEVKARLPELVTGVAEREEEIVVTRKGKPAAVLVNYAEYERLKETLDVLSDPELMEQIRRSERFFAAGGKGLSFEDVFGEPLVLPRKRRRP
jgi:antitoxin YefM